MKTLKLGRTEFFLFAFFSLAYAFLAPNIFQQDWDSLMYAYWSEVNGIKSIWGNHPLSHLLLNSIYVGLVSLGYHGKALPVFIICNSVISGFAVALFFLLMRIIKTDHLLSLGHTVIFGASYSMWHYAGSADVYSLSILLLVLAWIYLLYEVFVRKARYLYISGFLASLSVLSHQLNVVFFLVALIVILSQKADRWTRIITFYGLSAVSILAGFVITGYLAVSSFSALAIYEWMRGYLGDSIYGTYLKLESIPIAWKTAFGTVLVPTYGRSRFVRTIIYSFFMGIVLLGITQIKLLGPTKRIVLLAGLSQCLVSWLLIFWFEPWYPKFWLLTLIPGMIVLACCMHAVEKSFTRWFPYLQDYRKYYSLSLIVLGLLVVIFNMRGAILNEHKPDVTSQESMNIWLQNSDRRDMLITAGDLIPQLWFWADRPDTIHLYHYLVVDRYSNDRFAYLRKQIEQRLCSGETVLFAPAIADNFGESFLSWLDLSRDDLRMFFNAYGKEKVFTYRSQAGKEMQVYRLVDSDSCDH